MKFLFKGIPGKFERQGLCFCSLGTAFHNGFRRSLPPDKIAKILCVSLGAFYTQKSRVLDKIREIARISGSL